MEYELLRILLNQASKLGAKGYEVTGWVPPTRATEDPKGALIYYKPEPASAVEKNWYEK